ESLVFDCIILGAKVPAAAPRLVAHAPELDVERLRRTVLAALLRERRISCEIAVLDPVAQLARRSAAEISRQIRLRADEPAQIDELMRAEAVALDRLAPPQVDRPRPLLSRADAIGPVIVIRKTPAGP